MSGTDKINAANELRSFANRFKNVLACADDLEKLGSIENALNEAQSRVDGLKLQEEAINERILNSGKEFAAAQAEARALANQIVADAQAQADALKKEAAEAADTAARTAEATVQEATRKAQEVGRQTVEARATLAGVNDEIAKARATLAEVNAELDRVRKRFG